MKNRPFILKGKINLKRDLDYIIGKTIVNDNFIDENKENYIQVITEDKYEIYEDGYKAYIFEKNIPTNFNLNNNYCINVENCETLINYDVIEIINNRYIKVLYRNDSTDNAILVTNQCNSNCIMCPDADVVRKVTFNANIDELVEQIKNTPNDTVHLTITGGEPGLLKDGLIDVIKACKEYLPSTEFTLLSNGRVFSNTEFVNKFKENIPNNIKIAIPLYSDNNELHDSITRAKGSFKQTVCGIKKLLKRNIDVEIRIVVLKKNYKILPDIAKFISNEFSNVKLVNIMALEMTGNAFENRNDVWINFESIKEYVYQSCITFIKSGILVNLYNFPLCCIDKRLYSIANKSISDYKIRYKEECEKCKVKENCGGFFSSTINMKDIKINPIL